MSTWYQYNVHAIGVDKRAVAQFFRLPEKDVYSEHFEMSFGGKNGARVPFWHWIEKHPDIIWLVEQQIECDTVNWWIERYDNIVQKHQRVDIQSTYGRDVEINKHILDDYERVYPGLLKKHLAGEKGYECFRWEMFFANFSRAATILRRSKDYEEMASPIFDADIDFDNQPLEND